MDTIDRVFISMFIVIGGFLVYIVGVDYTDSKFCKHIGGTYVQGKCLKDKEEVR
jgi:hypothetical protein